MEENKGLIDVVLTEEGNIAEKVFGEEASVVDQKTKEFVERADRPAENGPRSEKPFWDTVHEGTKKLVEERPDLCKLI